jgi:hypothetical protein
MAATDPAAVVNAGSRAGKSLVTESVRNEPGSLTGIRARGRTVSGATPNHASGSENVTTFCSKAIVCEARVLRVHRGAETIPDASAGRV